VAIAADNSLTRVSRKAGEWVEGPFRLAAALSTTKAGGDVTEALARTTRLHFDYSQLSALDVKMKRLIPFWTFMSRNLPLQMQQQFLKPRAYQHYAALRQNFDMGSEDDVIPKQWEDAGAFSIGEGWMAQPDLPFTRLDESAATFTDPLKMFSQFNPAIRIPAELIADKKAYSGNSFYEGENKWLYALSGAIPPVYRADALSGGEVTGMFGGDESYKDDAQLGAVASFLGVPVKELTQGRINSELKRLAREGR
jgi:hypothetical protein